MGLPWTLSKLRIEYGYGSPGIFGALSLLNLLPVPPLTTVCQAFI